MSEPLHLTEENRAAVRALVNQIVTVEQRHEFKRGARIVTGLDMSLRDELSAITRRAFVPKMTVQIYSSSPLVKALMDASAQTPGQITRYSGYDSFDLEGPKMKAQKRFDQLDARRRKSQMRGTKV